MTYYWSQKSISTWIHGSIDLILMKKDRHFRSASRGIIRLGCHLCGLRPSNLSGHHRPGGDVATWMAFCWMASVCCDCCVFSSLGTKHLGPFWDQRPGTQFGSGFFGIDWRVMA